MYDTLSCYAIEEGWFLVILVIAASAAIVIGYVLVARPLKGWFVAILRNRTAIKIKYEGKGGSSEGPINALIVVLVWFALIGLPLYIIWVAFRAVDGYYALAIDASSSPTLGQVREMVLSSDQRTRLTIKLADEVLGTKLTGRYEGKCVADVLQVICNKMHQQLECRRSISERRISIGPRAPKLAH